MMVAGERWERISTIPSLVPGLPAGTVSAWASSGHIRRVRSGGESWVAFADVLVADAARRRRRAPARRV